MIRILDVYGNLVKLCYSSYEAAEYLNVPKYLVEVISKKRVGSKLIRGQNNTGKQFQIFTE